MKDKAIRVLLAGALFLSAFLLFMIQLMTAKMILPLLGGAPAVWNTCMVFFQFLLLAGYYYAHILSTKFSALRQFVVTLIVTLAASFFLPISIPQCWAVPSENFPIVSIFTLLILVVALPFFSLSANAPLIQKWYSKINTSASKDPYFLYAASNAGSLSALLFYPFYFEPRMNISGQSHLWTALFYVLAVLLLLCGVRLLKPFSSGAKAVTEKTASKKNDHVPTSRKVKWVWLAFLPSSLMMGVTTYISTDIAAVPLIWIIPLGLYLVSFILVFSNTEIIPSRFIKAVFLRAIMGLAFLMAIKCSSPMSLIMSANLLVFFLVAMLCHGQLAKDRPSTDHLTEYYLWLSFGGVLGGLFNGIVAPLIFDRAVEYPLILALSCLALPMEEKPGSTLKKIMDFIAPAAMGLAVFFAYNQFIIEMSQKMNNMAILKLVLTLVVGVPALLSFSFRKRPLRFALAIGCLMFLGLYAQAASESILTVKRSFFGVSLIKKIHIADSDYNIYVHGTTVHGLQNLKQDLKKEPLSYYSKSGPFGDIFSQLRKKNALGGARVAVVGLGAGASAVYAAMGDHWDFYEIDPVVAMIAKDERYFTFLKDCPAKWQVILGDGRLNLKNSQDGHYDLIVLDAFSSDAIPIHLMTKQAIELYMLKLKKNGFLAFHVTNRYLKLQPVLQRIGRALGLSVYSCFDVTAQKGMPSELRSVVYPSQWVVMAKDDSSISEFLANTRWKTALSGLKESPVWTDDFSNILSAL